MELLASIYRALRIYECRTMLLLSLCIIFLSPITMFSVTSVSLPKIDVFTHFFSDEVNSVRKKIVKVLQLQCKISGHPLPKLEFQFNGVTINNSSKVIRHNNILNIRDVRYPDDEGVYRCVATNSNGKEFKDKHIKIEAVGEFLPGQRFEDKVLFHNAILGQELEIACPEHTYTYPIKYFWGFVDGNRKMKMLKETPSLHITEKGGLFITSVSRDIVNKISSGGGIRCIARRGHKDLPSFIYSRRHALTIVGTKYNDTAPYIIIHSSAKIYAKKGESVTLSCIAKGNPLPEIKWFRNGVQIQSNDSRYGINAYLPSKLTIRDIDSSIIGQFKCTATNRAGTDEKYGSLLLAQPAKLVKSLPMTFGIARGENLHLNCLATGTEPITYQWYRNGSLLSSYSLNGISMIIKGGELKISFVKYADKGIYQCISMNKYGSSSSVGNVIITEPGAKENTTTGKNKSSNRDKDNGETRPEPGKNNTKSEDNTSELTSQHIILIACGASVFVILIGGGIFMYCRTKNDSKEVRFIPTPRPELSKSVSVTDYLPPPPRSLTDSDDDDMSSFGGAQINAPEFINLMSEIRCRQSESTISSDKQENFYYDIPENRQYNMHTTPNTEL